MNESKTNANGGVPRNTVVNKTGPRDVFLQLLAIITLYMSAISFGALLFQFINIYFPDTLNNYSYYRSEQGALRFSLAMLVIVFPIFVWVSRFLKREISQIPAKAEMRIRKWLLSFTLFAAGLLIIGDLISLVNKYLEGDLTGRFLLKVLVILTIAAVIFRYYLWQLKEGANAPDKAIKWMEQGVIVFVGIVLVAGFVLAGSPQSERLRRFDERRVNDLRSIQWQVVSFWQQKERLPENLGELNDRISGYSAPIDPETDEAYEYNILDNLTFELCATFNGENKSEFDGQKNIRAVYQPEDLQDNWSHIAGRVCFEREIDPELYGDNREIRKPIPQPIPLR